MSGKQLVTVIDLGKLQAGLTYRFGLTGLGNGGAGYAEVSILVNTPPLAGTCTVDPPAGVAVVTLFLLACADWIDDPSDLPFRFAVRALTMSQTVVRSH